jgi:hypothetical protein
VGNHAGAPWEVTAGQFISRAQAEIAVSRQNISGLVYTSGQRGRNVPSKFVATYQLCCSICCDAKNNFANAARGDVRAARKFYGVNEQ